MVPQIPHFHRQRFILQFLESSHRNLTKIEFQKLIFHFQHLHNLRYFSFIPFKYGCYSFQLQSDLELLEKRNWLTIEPNSINLKHSAKSLIDSKFKTLFQDFFIKEGQLQGENLIKFVYKNYPWWATKSKISQKIMSEKDLNIINHHKNSIQNPEFRFFTIGYEGIHFEEYLNKLIKNKIQMLIDVRKNPYSRKFGFKKSKLTEILPKLDIKYLNIPELGIENENRKNLVTKEDYKILFQNYSKTLPTKTTYLDQITSYLSGNLRIALTCFEKEPIFCHRHCISDYIEENSNIKTKHL